MQKSNLSVPTFNPYGGGGAAQSPETFALADIPPKTVDNNAQAVFLSVPAANYRLAVARETNNWDVYNQNIAVTTTNVNSNVEVAPLWVVNVNVETGTVVTFTGVYNGTQTSSTGTIVLENVPAGTVNYSATKSGAQTTTGSFTLGNSSTNPFPVPITLNKLPRLELKTVDLTNFLMDQSYKYVSFLLVGYGKNGSGGTSGGSGELKFIKNIPIDSESMITNLGFYLEYNGNFENVVILEYKDSNEDNGSIIVGTLSAESISSNGATHNSSEFYTYQTDAYFSNGAGAGGVSSTSGGSGGAGSSGAGGNGNVGTLAVGGLGGDGIGGFKGGDGVGGLVGGTGQTKGVVIPLASIFNGIGKGGDSYTNRGGGAGGYGNGGSGGDGGYGAGGVNYANGGSGLLCIYYHDGEI